MPLNEAIEGAIRIYEKEHRHPAPVEAVAQHLGYKSANNGTAVKAMASIRYYGLLDRPSDGQLAVVKDVESYQFAPSPEVRRDLIKRWLKTPPVFAELLDKFQEALPSDATLRFELIQRGFLPDAVDAVVGVFRSSVEFARYYEKAPQAPESSPAEVSGSEQASGDATEPPTPAQANNANIDRIPIRLPGGRRAWLEIPTPFYNSDKERLKKQIDLLLTAEDEAVASS